MPMFLGLGFFLPWAVEDEGLLGFNWFQLRVS